MKKHEHDGASAEIETRELSDAELENLAGGVAHAALLITELDGPPTDTS